MLPIRTILHPTDFSDCSRHAGDFAAKVAKDYGALLVFLHVVEPPFSSPEHAVGERPFQREKAEGELREIERSYPELFTTATKRNMAFRNTTQRPIPSQAARACWQGIPWIGRLRHTLAS
jgi:nucleotide-binding universal stress UspA family protein